MGNVALETNGINKCVAILLNGVVSRKFHRFQKSNNHDVLAQITVYINEMLESFDQVSSSVKEHQKVIENEKSKQSLKNSI